LPWVEELSDEGRGVEINKGGGLGG